MPASPQNENRVLGHLARDLPQLLPDFLLRQRWFGGKAQGIESTKVVDVVPVNSERVTGVYIVLARVEYAPGAAETYVLPLKSTSREPAARERQDRGTPPGLRISGEGSGDDLVFCDALWDRDFSLQILDSIRQGLAFKGGRGEVKAVPTPALQRILRGLEGEVEPSLLKGEQSNTSIVYGSRLILKLFRRLEEGINPDVEIGTFLTERTSFAHIPPVAGSIVYRRHGTEPTSIGILQGFVPNQGDAWRFTLAALRQYFEQVAALLAPQLPPLPPGTLLALAQEDVPRRACDLIGAYLDSARLLGQRTAELHTALASDPNDPNFAPEPFSMSYQNSIHQAMATRATRAFQLLSTRLRHLPEEARERAEKVLRLEDEVQRGLHKILEREIRAMRTRVHGDYHLGQVLCTESDFVIIDFEGEPARSLNERRTKRSPLQDVAGMLRSFHYATESALSALAAGDVVLKGSLAMKRWARYWQSYVSSVFLKSYLSTVAQTPCLPEKHEDLDTLLNAFLLEKVMYELEYELNNRPTWVSIPLDGIVQVVDHLRCVTSNG